MITGTPSMRMRTGFSRMPRMVRPNGELTTALHRKNTTAMTAGAVPIGGAAGEIEVEPAEERRDLVAEEPVGAARDRLEPVVGDRCSSVATASVSMTSVRPRVRSTSGPASSAPTPPATAGDDEARDRLGA